MYSPHTSNKYMSVGKDKKNGEMKNIYLFFLGGLGGRGRKKMFLVLFYITFLCEGENKLVGGVCPNNCVHIVCLW